MMIQSRALANEWLETKRLQHKERKRLKLAYISDGVEQMGWLQTAARKLNVCQKHLAGAHSALACFSLWCFSVVPLQETISVGMRPHSHYRLSVHVHVSTVHISTVHMHISTAHAQWHRAP